MSYLELKGVAIRGVSAAVPKQVLNNRAFTQSRGREMERVIKAIGADSRRMAQENQCASDFCFSAAESLLKALQWRCEDVDALVLVTISGDYKQPPTVCILQHRLNLPKSTVAIELNLGCSGFIYGLYTLASMMIAGTMKRAILLCGDTSIRGYSERDLSGFLSYGDAGTATAVELDSSADPMHFELGTYGAGWSLIHTPAGGSRRPVTSDSLVYKDVGGGDFRRDIDCVIQGAEVFNWSIQTASETVKRMLAHLKLEVKDVDQFVFQQASLLVLDFVRRKLSIPADKFPLSINQFGNPGSASIPLTLVTRRSDAIQTSKNSVILSSFGLGLSWATCYTRLGPIVCPPLIEV